MEPEQAAEFREAGADAGTRLSRASCDVCRDALNTPAFLAMLPSVRGLTGLDIGCGQGSPTHASPNLPAHPRPKTGRHQFSVP